MPKQAAEREMLRLEGIRQEFDGVVALREVTFGVVSGERHAIIGPNGAGKTTLFNVISGLARPVSGRVYFAGQDVTGRPPHWLNRQGLARTFQHSSLFLRATVFENVRLAVQSRVGVSHDWFRPADGYATVKQQVEELLDHLHLKSLAREPVRALPYGIQRQVELAIALACRPRLLLLDEPTAGMSPSETAEIVATIRSLPREITVLIIEHDMDVVFALADRITVLHHGEVLAHGTADEIRQDTRVLDIYLGKALKHKERA